MGELTIVKVKPLPKWEDPSSNHHFCCAKLIATKGWEKLVNFCLSTSHVPSYSGMFWSINGETSNSGINGCGIQHAI
jgi:hypothetical protein